LYLWHSRRGWLHFHKKKEKNRKNGKTVCDYVYNSTTFNTGATSFGGTMTQHLDIPNVGKILAFISDTGSTRDVGTKVNHLIKLVVNAWRVNTDNRIVKVSDILNWAKGNGAIRSKIPKCP